MITIGLTGGIATGKSTVSKLLREQGIPVLSADELAHQAIAPGADGFHQVVSHFGARVLNPAGAIDRKVLGEIVFDDPESRRSLEQIIHPRVIAAIEVKQQVAAATGVNIFVVEVPLLFEVGLTGLFDRIWVVSMKPELQKQRLMERSQLTAAEAEQRIAAQLPLSVKEGKADLVIYNNKGFSELQREVIEALKTLE